MRRDVRELIERAAEWGYTNEGLDGRGHYCLRHRTGQTARVPATPSEYRSLLNVEAQLRRMAQAHKEGPKHRRSRKAVEAPQFDMRSTRKHLDGRLAGVIAEVEDLNREASDIADQLTWLVAEPNRTNAALALPLLQRHAAICERLTALHKPSPVLNL